MNDTPTPETERIKGALHTNWNDLMNHARKLERERDEAIIKYTGQANEFEKHRNVALAKLEEAREVNAKLRDIAERAINYLDQSYRDGFSDEVSDFRYELEQLKEETK